MTLWLLSKQCSHGRSVSSSVSFEQKSSLRAVASCLPGKGDKKKGSEYLSKVATHCVDVLSKMVTKKVPLSEVIKKQVLSPGDMTTAEKRQKWCFDGTSG